jgi:Fe-S cluster biogenesis protein NfuA
MMDPTETLIRELVAEELQPKVRVDGGDVEFERLDRDTIYLGAYADCATCPAAPDRLRWWCEKVFEQALGRRYAVVIVKHPPYYGG